MEKYKKVKIVGKGNFGYAVLVESKTIKKQYIMSVSKTDKGSLDGP